VSRVVSVRHVRLASSVKMSRSRVTVVPNLVQQCRWAKLPATVTEHRFHPLRQWKFDLAFVDAQLAVEVDGGGFVEGRHTRGRGLEKDAEKFAEAAILGWTVLRVTPRQVRHWQALGWIERWFSSRAPSPLVQRAETAHARMWSELRTFLSRRDVNLQRAVEIMDTIEAAGGTQ
jgi:very-short-patch-repair endonuclease